MIWLVFFFIIVAASFVLAYLSMKDFPDILSAKQGGVFLIKKPQNLNATVLETIKNKFNKGQIISFERLFKGSQSALVVFGPRGLLELGDLDLLELEDYCFVDSTNVTAWEATVRGDPPENIFNEIPQLGINEQFWWQVTLRVTKNNFQTEIRSVVCAEGDRRQDLVTKFQDLNSKLIKLPKPLTSNQILISYQKRTIVPLSEDPLVLTGQQVLSLLGKS